MNKNFKLILKEILLIILFLFLSLTTAEIGSYILPQYEYQLSFVITAFILLAAYKILKLIFKSLYLIHSNKFSTFCFWGAVIGLTGILSLFIGYIVFFLLIILIIGLMKKSNFTSRDFHSRKYYGTRYSKEEEYLFRKDDDIVTLYLDK